MKSENIAGWIVVAVFFIAIFFYIARMDGGSEYEDCYVDYGGGIGGSSEVICY